MPSQSPLGKALDEILWELKFQKLWLGSGHSMLSDTAVHSADSGGAGGRRSFGIPCRSLGYSFCYSSGGLTVITNGHLVQDSRRYRPPRVIPLEILWRGLAINSVFFASVALGTSVAWQLAITAHRRRHSRCPTCGYSTTGLPTPTCPECAAAINRYCSRGNSCTPKA